MNKDKLEVGDLVTHVSMDYRQIPLDSLGVGLIIDVSYHRLWPQSRVYWFRSGKSFRYPPRNLAKLSPTQEEAK